MKWACFICLNSQRREMTPGVSDTDCTDLYRICEGFPVHLCHEKLIAEEDLLHRLLASAMASPWNYGPGCQAPMSSDSTQIGNPASETSFACNGLALIFVIKGRYARYKADRTI